MSKSSELIEIRHMIFQYKDTADIAEKNQLKILLKHELNLLKKNM